MFENLDPGVLDEEADGLERHFAVEASNRDAEGLQLGRVEAVAGDELAERVVVKVLDVVEVGRDRSDVRKQFEEKQKFFETNRFFGKQKFKVSESGKLQVVG